MVFENLFRMDPIISDLSMTTILEENNGCPSSSTSATTTTAPANIIQGGGGEGSRKLFKKNGTNSGKYNPPPSSLSVDGSSGCSSSCSSSSSTTGSSGSGGGSISGASSLSSFVRSGSSKSYAKNRRPLSRLWQMRRRSFSQFELHSVETLFGLGGSSNNSSGGVSCGNEFVPMGGNGSCTEIDADNAGTSGFFHPIGDDFWSSETDLTASTSSSSFTRNNRYAVCFLFKKITSTKEFITKQI